MSEFLSMISLPMCVVAGFIAYLGWDTKYRYIGLLLFIDFIFMTGYERFVINSFTFTDQKELAIFYGYKLLIQAVFSIGYLHLQSKSLFYISNTIISVLFISVIMSLRGMDVVLYEGVMLTLSISQLIAGFGGAIGGYCNIVDNIRGRFVYIRDKIVLRRSKK